MDDKDYEAILRLTGSRHWDFPMFREVVSALAKTESYIPAHHCPDSIHIQGFRSRLDHLADLAKEHDAEVAQPFFMDIETNHFIFGRITKGTRTSVRVDTQRQAGKDHCQKLVLSAHIHPLMVDGPGFGFGFSDEDYKSILQDPQLQGGIMRIGGVLFMALKTSATSNKLRNDSVRRQVAQARRDFLEQSSQLMPISRLIDFNRSVCTEFGLILFMANEKQRDLMERVIVAY